jgi:hypothetical protein
MQNNSPLQKSVRCYPLQKESVVVRVLNKYQLFLQKNLVIIPNLYTFAPATGNWSLQMAAVQGNRVRIPDSTCCCNPRLRGLPV